MAANHQHLRAFHVIAVEGGVSRAARRLNLSQPTLSQQLKALESRYGVTLFESRKVPLRLSPAGHDLLALTRKLFATAADIDDLLGDTAGPAGGALRLGSDSPLYAAQLVEQFRRRHPDTGIQIRMGSAREVMRWLDAAEIDAAVASDPPAQAAFSYDPLFTDRLACALRHDHPLAAGASVPIGALSHETLILREPTSKTRAFTERALGDAEVRPRATLELQSRETIREGIALGLGLSIFLTSECPPDPRITYRPLDTGTRDYRLRSYLVCQSDRRRSAVLRALREIALEMRVAEDDDASAPNVMPAQAGISR